MEKRRLNTLCDNADLKVGDFILFQEYRQGSYIYTEDKSNGNYQYDVSKPILAIYLGFYVVDQAGAFNYVKWLNNNREKVTSDTGHKYMKEIDDMEHHIEWDDFVDILGRWTHRPSQKEILAAYRNYNMDSAIMGYEFETD